MSAVRRSIPAAGLAVAMAAMTLPASPAEAQPTRPLGCEVATDLIEKLRRVRAPATRATPANLARAVRTGKLMGRGCRSDEDFLVAYALARIELSGDIQNTALEARTAYFNAGLADLELVRRSVLRGESERFDIFSILGRIYNDIQQYEKSLAVLLESAPYFGRLSAASRRESLFTKGMAYYHLGRREEAANSFANAGKFGHPDAARLEAQMRKDP